MAASDFPDGWITATLKACGLPVTDFTMKAMSAWADSTPMLAYTNNPIGMPAVKGKTLELMRTGYAMYPTMADFRTALAAFLVTVSGKDVRESFALDEKYSKVYRAVHALKWPANATETDWPSSVLDLTSESYRTKAATVASPADRKTSGAFGAQAPFGTGAAISSRNAARVASFIQDATTAVQRGVGR